VSLTADSDPVELCNTDRCKTTLTHDPDDLLLNIDRGSAIGRLVLRTLFGQAQTPDFPAALQTEIDEIRAERNKKVGSQATLIVEAYGSQATLIVEAYGLTDAVIKEPAREHSGFIVTFDAVDKEVLRLNHRAEVEATMLAVAMESEEPSRFALLNEGVYLTNNEGSNVYSISLEGAQKLSLQNF
jgi:hypothetical protein